tara:strand:- start:713 stop:1024 length:312 start_codon:yes stop_codon:yes gene_type:complete
MSTDSEIHHIVYEFIWQEKDLHLKIFIDIMARKLPDSNFCMGGIIFKDIQFADDGESLDEEEMTHFLNQFGEHITDRCVDHILNHKEKESNSGKSNTDTPTLH